MKKTLTICAAILTLGFVGWTAIDSSSNDKVINVAQAESQIATFAVENMTCATCPIAVRKAMSKVEGVSNVEVDFVSKIATVTFDPDAVKAEVIALASTNAGYPASETIKQ